MNGEQAIKFCNILKTELFDKNGTSREQLILETAPEMLRILRNIVSSAPLKGLPLALENDIQSACNIITKIDRGTK